MRWSGRAKAVVHRGVVRAAHGRGGTGARAYYLLRSSVFVHEQRAVLSGRMRHENRQERHGDLHRMRRNVHRLEKGLTMRPARPVFAVDYIVETVAAYERLRGQGTCVEDLRWASDVLSRYFDSVDVAADVAVRRAADSFCPLEGTRSTLRSPFVRGPRPEGAASAEAVMALAGHRRSTRWFTTQPVTRAELDVPLRAAATAPSACNRQSFRFLVFDEPDRVREVLEVPMGTAGWGHQVPVAIMVVGQLRGYPAERDRHVVYIDGSLAVMSFILAAEAAGLGTCSVNWAALPDREKAIRDRVTLADDEVVVMLLAVGHPDPLAAVPFSAKRSLSDLVEYNRA